MTQSPPTPPSSPQGVPLKEAPGATTGLILGILSIVMNIPLIGFIMALIGFMKSREAKAMCDANPGLYSNAGIATAGYVCSIIGMVLGSLSMICGCGYGLMLLGLIGSGVAGGAAGI